MKKIIALFLSFFVFLMIPGCGKSNKSKPAVNIVSTEQTNLSQEDNIGEIYCADIDEEHIAATDDGIMYADNEILLVANDGVSYDEINQLAENYHAEIVGWIEQTGDYQLQLSDDHTMDELESIAKNMQAETIVESASIDYVFNCKLDEIKYGREWEDDLQDYNDLQGRSWGIEAICAPDAWNELEKNKDKVKPVRVGLYDIGFDSKSIQQRDLQFNEVLYNKYNKEEFLTWYNHLPETTDDERNEKKSYSHGTHVAGTMAALSDNDEGICGVYPYGRNNLYAVSLWGTDNYTENGDFKQSIIQSKIAYAELILRNVKVINTSLGFNWYQNYFDTNTKTFNYQAELNFYQTNDWSDLANFAHGLGEFLNRLIQKGYDFVLVSSAGNNSDSSIGHLESKYNNWLNLIEREEFPDVYDRIIVVGSVTPSLNTSDFSDTGERLDVFAPGEKIYSCVLENTNYDYMQGTSMAAPHISGVAAMVWSANNALTGAEVKKIICETAEYDPFDKSAPSILGKKHNNLVNAKKAVLKALNFNNGNQTEEAALQNGSILCWVVDEENENNKIANANISAANIETGKTEETTTDESGHFELILPVGKYVLTIKADGYQEYHASEIEVKNEEVTYPNWIKLKKQKTELSVYLKTDLPSFVELIGNMNRLDTSDGTQEYKNEAIIVSATPVPGYIDFISIENTCDYTIHGMYYGMPFSEAVSLAEKDSTSVLDNLPNYKYYCMRDGTQISIHANEENKLDGIAIFAENSESEVTPTPNPDNLIALAQKIYDSHTYTYDTSWDTTNYLYCIAETKKGLCLVVNEGGGLGSKTWVYDQNGEMKVNSESYAGVALHFDDSYYDIFANASGDGTRYIDMYYPDEHQYYENYEYNNDSEKTNFSWTLDNESISKDVFEKIYQEYENNSIYTYQYEQGIVY